MPDEFFPAIESQMHHGYIETTIKADGLYRVYRPFRHWEYFLFKINSVEEELRLDKERMKIIEEQGAPRIPMPSDYMDADELNDYYRDDSFSGQARLNDEEVQ